MRRRSLSWQLVGSACALVLAAIALALALSRVLDGVVAGAITAAVMLPVTAVVLWRPLGEIRAK
jgi:hypothetical protein